MLEKNKKIKFIPTQRNEFLEPRFGKGLVVGYDPEIHEEDAKKVVFKLPIGAVKRLIFSYCKDIENFHSEWVYSNTVGSIGMRRNQYAQRMIVFIEKQLNRQKIDGEELFKLVYNESFKESADRMKRFYKNHGDAAPFEPCNDPNCCKKTKSR